MRIVQLLTQDHGGPADHAVDVACELARRGQDSHLVGPTDRFAAQLAAAGVTAHPAVMTGKRDLGGARAVLDVLRRLRPDVLHSHDRRAGLIGRAGGRALRLPALVYTLHGVADGLADLLAGCLPAAPRRRRDSLYYLRAERWLYAATRARVIAPSEAIARYAVDHVRLPETAVDVVANGIDTDRFRPGPSRPDGGMPTALWLGLMVPVKRVDLLLAALADVPELQLKLAGAGPEYDRLVAAAQRAGLAARVEFVGAVRDPCALLAAADLFVLPSAAENCPLALLQAMASGVAVVATQVGGVPEVVRDGVDGLLVPAGDTAALAGALQRLSADAAERRAMGARARERIAAHYTIAGCVDGLLASYARAAA